MAVIGASPVTFISEDTSKPNAGLQYQIPLSLISIDSSGQADFSGWPAFGGLATSDQALVNTYVNSLISQGLLAAPPT